MANKRAVNGCVEIKICVSDDLDQRIIEYQLEKKLKEKIKIYNKPDAAVDLFMELLNKK